MYNKPSQEILKADPSARRNAVLIVIFGLILGILILKLWLPLFFEYLDALPTKKSIRIVISFLAILSIIPLTIGFLMLKHGLKIIRTESFPAPGTKVLKDTPIVKGEKARWRGIVLIIISLVILACGVFNATVLPYGFNKLLNEKANEKAESKNQIERVRNTPH
jgi:hypothetical protein